MASFTFLLQDSGHKMKIPPPSKLSAAASGIALGLAAPMLDAIQQIPGLAPHMREALFISVISLLIFIPATFFVVGIEYWTRSMDKKSRGTVAIDKDTIMRVLCWFAGGGLAFAVFGMLRGVLEL
jgi:hypothetical protein